MAVGSVWHRPGRKPGLRRHPQWWRVLKAQGRCVQCWKPRDREGASCRRCCERTKLQMRRKRGWDGKSPWKPKRAGRGVRHYVGCSLPHSDYLLMQRLMREDKITAGAVVREALQSYLGDIFEERTESSQSDDAVAGQVG